MWKNRQRFENNWSQLHNPCMKNAQNGHPFVSIDPEIENLIESYLSNRPSTSVGNLFVSKDGGIITAARANYFCNLSWNEFRQTGNNRYPKRFRFNNQRYSIATKARHDPVDGQPPLEIYNGLLVSDFNTLYMIFHSFGNRSTLTKPLDKGT